MRIFSIFICLLFNYPAYSFELKINNYILSSKDCLQLKEGKKSKYIKDSYEILKVLEIINSDKDQIIIQSMKTKYYDYLDQNDVRVIKCPE